MADEIEQATTHRPFFEAFLERLSTSASVKTVYGEPITAHGKTIVPVARVAYGFGLGSGEGRVKMKTSAEAAGPSGSGAGGGGGVVVHPVGVIEITPTSTRFVRYRQNPLLIGALTLGFVSALIFGRRWRR